MGNAMLHLLILTILPLSLSTPLSALLAPPVPLPDLRCFPADAPYDLHPIVTADCRQLVNDIAALDIPRGKRWTFGAADIPGVELVIPVKYSRKTCIAHIIDTDSSEPAGDTFTMRYLSQKVARLAELCARPAPHLGGEGRIGEKGVLALVVVGVGFPPQGGGADGGVLATGLNGTLEGVESGFVVAQNGISRVVTPPRETGVL